MLRPERNVKSSGSGERIDFKFSNFQALQVPKAWDKLLVSIISIETGKTIARSNKALVRNGNCLWTETLSKSIWISHCDSSKDLEEHLFKFVVCMGSRSRSAILGEATINIARYYTSSRSSSTISLPLKKCNYGTILQVKIQCLTPRIKHRSNMDTSYGPNQNDDLAEYSLEKETFYQKSHISNCRNSSPSNCPIEEDVSVSKSNNSSFRSRITHDDQEQEYAPPSSTVMNVGSSKNLLEAAEDTIEELLEKEYKTSLSVKEQNINNLESKLSERKEIENHQMREIQWLKMIVSEVEKECSKLTNENLDLIASLDSQVSANKLLEQQAMKIEKVKCEVELSLFETEEENIKLLDRVSELESQLTLVKAELEKTESEKQKLQESAENLIEECNVLQKSYEDMTKGNAELYDQYSCLVIDLTSETEKFQKEVEHLKEEISRLDEQKSKLTFEKSKLESSLKQVHSRTEMTEHEIQTVREESESKIQDLITELSAIKQNHKKLMTDYEKKSKLLSRYRTREEQSQQLIEKLKNEKSNLEASLHSDSNSFEELKAEKMSFFNKMSEFEDCKSQRDALEEKLLRLERDLTAKNASCLQDADIKNEISRVKSANLQYQLKIQQLEGEENECLMKMGVHETRSQDDTDYATKIKMLEAELNEALDAKNKYKVQLQKLKSKGHNKSKVEGEGVTKERSRRTKSSLETELKELRDRYLEMSLKYAEVEAEREDLIMQLKTNNSARKRFQFLEKS